MKNKQIRFTTPKGIAEYPWLNEPDTKFNPEGDYKVNLVLNEDEAKPLLSKLDKLLDDFMSNSDDVKRAISQRKNVTKGDVFTYDEEGNVVLKFKQKAMIHTKDGKDYPVKIALFDSKGVPCSAKIGGGSTIKVAFSVFPYYMPTTKTCGLSLRPVAVQVIDLVEYGENNAESYGFTEEDGYQSDPKDGANEKGEVPWEDINEDIPNEGDF